MKSKTDRARMPLSQPDGGWTYIRLKDGRQIARPPKGGRFSKAEIRSAVKKAVAAQG